MKHWKKHALIAAAILAMATAVGFYGNTASAADYNDPPEIMEHHDGRDYHISLVNAGNDQPPAFRFHDGKHHPGEFHKRPPKPRKECRNPEEHKRIRHEMKEHHKKYHPEWEGKHHKEYRD